MHVTQHRDWNPGEQMAFGLIYGAILVLSILMALAEAPETPYRPATVLFSSVLAVTLAKAFSELLAHAIQSRERLLTRTALTAAWRHARPTLAVANVPSLVLLVAGDGLMDFQVAVAASQLFCVTILAILGARVGWAISPKSWLPVVGATLAGGIGSALAALKYAIH
ncbi:MAG: hypothetical protein SFX73_34820 [Kofleriaceae bacterium]|nr:hypothetical protein [Kofleriaceae bacterium]